jgi:hypothetical protein
MRQPSTLYIAVSSPDYWAELANVQDYGWPISPNTDNAPWFVVDSYYKKAYYTFVPPGGPGTTVIATSTQLASQLPPKPPVILPTSSNPPTAPVIYDLNVTPEGGDTL